MAPARVIEAIDVLKNGTCTVRPRFGVRCKLKRHAINVSIAALLLEPEETGRQACSLCEQLKAARFPIHRDLAK